MQPGRGAFPFRRETAGQIFRFGLSSGLSALVSLGLPILLHERLLVDQRLAVAISQASVLLINFAVIRLFVFRSAGPARADFFRYIGSVVVFRLLEYLGFLILSELAHLYYVTALLVTLVTSTLIKFFWYKFLFARTEH